MTEEVYKLIKEAKDTQSDTLSLAGQELTSIPSEVFELVNLRTLRLNRNKLTSIPKEIGNLKNLVSLTLSANEIEEIPDELFDLENLETLSLKKNKIKEIPENIRKLKKLVNLSAPENQIENIADGLGELSSLKYLYIRKNKIRRLPKTFGKLINLKNINLDGNPIEYPDIKIVKAGLMRIMLFFLIDEQSKNNFSGFEFKVPQEMTTAVKQYLIYFQEYVQKTKGKKIVFEVRSTDEGVLIETSNSDNLNEINSYFNEYLSFVKSNIDDLQPKFEVPVTDPKKELVVLELKQQVVHLKQQIEFKNFQVKYLENQVSDYFNLLTLQNSRPLPIYINALSNSNSHSESNSTATADVAIDISVELPNLQQGIFELKNNDELPEDIKKEIITIDDELLDIEPEDAENTDKKPFKRIKRIFDQLSDEKSTFNETVKKSKKLKDSLQKLGKSYNKFAQWLALPVIPDLLLEI